MKKSNILGFSKHIRATDLVEKMESIEVQKHRSKLKKLIAQRKKKIKQLMGHKEIHQPNIIYLKKNHGDFSFIESNASKQPFISQKKKRRNQISDRAYCSSPNMKAGHPSNNVQNQEETHNKIILNKRFIQYDRIIDEQSGLRKMQTLQKLREGKIYAYPRKKSNQMKRTFFQKMVLDKYNFYKDNDYVSIRSSMLASSKTDNDIKTQVHILTKLKSVTTLDSSYRDREYSTLENSTLNKSRIKNKKMTEFDIYKSQLNARSRIKSQDSQIMPISFHKNLDSIDN